MKRKAHGTQKPRHIKRIVEVASTTQRSDSPAQAINQGFHNIIRNSIHLKEKETSGELLHGIGIKKALSDDTILGDSTKYPRSNALDNNLPQPPPDVNPSSSAAVPDAAGWRLGYTEIPRLEQAAFVRDKLFTPSNRTQERARNI